MYKKLILSLACVLVFAEGYSFEMEDNFKAFIASSKNSFNSPEINLRRGSHKHCHKRGPQGERGPRGIQGEQGPPGLGGSPGPQGVQGSSGIEGPTVTNNFASITVAEMFMEGMPGDTVSFPLSSSIFYQNGSLNVDPEGVVTVTEPGYYRINYGISTLIPGEQVVLVVDGVQLPGSAFSTATSNQSTSLSVIAHVVGSFFLRTTQGLLLNGNIPGGSPNASTTCFMCAKLLAADPI